MRPQPTCTVARVYEVAYGNCWWLMFDGGGRIAEHWWHSLSVGDFQLGSVSMWYPCSVAGMKLNLRSRLRQNTPLNLRQFLFTNSAMELMFLFIDIQIGEFLLDIQSIQIISSERFRLMYNFNFQYMSAACEKHMAIVSCLAPCTHKLLECVMFQLSEKPDQPGVCFRKRIFKIQSSRV